MGQVVKPALFFYQSAPAVSVGEEPAEVTIPMVTLEEMAARLEDLYKDNEEFPLWGT